MLCFSLCTYIYYEFIFTFRLDNSLTLMMDMSSR